MARTDSQKLAELYVVANNLVIQLDNVMETFETALGETMIVQVRQPLDSLKTTLQAIGPIEAEEWDGRFRIEDCEEELFTPRHLPTEYQRRDVGVRLTHRQTGRSVEVYQHGGLEENQTAARRALRKLVEKEAVGRG